MPNAQYRQGDVFIERVKSIPSNAKPAARDNGRIVLAYGEVTGHAHAISVDDEFAELLATETDRYLDVKQMSTITHEEHAPITLPPGKYRVVRQVEYSPETIRNVAD